MGWFNFPKNEKSSLVERVRADRIYQEFMIGYVKRINAETLNVTIGGVRIGSAKRSRLAQINLKSRIITFSRYAVEHVPEAGRRYLVIHELAHVKEPSHNKNFWQIVARYVPDYKQVEKELERCFRLNVKKDAAAVDPIAALNAFTDCHIDQGAIVHSAIAPSPAPAKKAIHAPIAESTLLLEKLLQQSFAVADTYAARDNGNSYPYFDPDDSDNGIVCGGSDDEDSGSEVYENFIS